MFIEIAKNIGELVERKNKAYGDSFKKAGDILKILFYSYTARWSLEPPEPKWDCNGNPDGF